MKPFLIAHRGDRKNFPENTIEAFYSAFEKGADGIELDVHLDKNGIPIVVHDYLHDKSFKYPHLENIIKLFKNKGRLEIEIKSFDPECVIKISKLLKKYNVKDYEITSSVLPLLPLVNKSLPNSKIGMIFNRHLIENWMTDDFIEELILGYMRLTKATILHLDLDLYTEKLVDALHKNHFLTHTHLANGGKTNYDKAVALKIDQCTFDNINLIKKVS